MLCFSICVYMCMHGLRLDNEMKEKDLVMIWRLLVLPFLLCYEFMLKGKDMVPHNFLHSFKVICCNPCVWRCFSQKCMLKEVLNMFLYMAFWFRLLVLSFGNGGYWFLLVSYCFPILGCHGTIFLLMPKFLDTSRCHGGTPQCHSTSFHLEK